MTRPFAEGVLTYAKAGWPVVPVPPETKTPPPRGFTGADGVDADPMQLARWLESHGASSIALRMPVNDEWAVIGIDDYAKGAVTKTGYATLSPAWSSRGRA